MAKQWSKPFDNTLEQGKTYSATLDTNFGKIDVELYPEDAPNTVNNFVNLAREGYYDGTPFHRIIAGFMAQGGDPTGTGTGGPGYKFKDEKIVKDYEPGTLAMANAGPNTNGSQFFICFTDLRGRLPKNYTIFGKVTNGFDTLQKIEAVPVRRSRSGEPSDPTQPVTLNSVTVTEA